MAASPRGSLSGALQGLARRMLTALTVAAVVLAVLWFGQRWVIYLPMSDPPSPAVAGLPFAEPVAFTTEDGLRLEGWFVPAAARPTGRTIIVFNGNAGHRGFRAPFAEALVLRGHQVLLFDYRGYGGNPGLPSETGLARDARAAREFLLTRDDVDPARIVYFGESLGSGVAVRLASEHPPEALVLRSPFTSLVDLGQHHYPFLPVRWLLRDRFPSIDLIASIRAPVLVIAGTADRVVPVEFSRSLYEAAAEPKFLVTFEGVDHNDAAMLDGTALVQAVSEFLSTLQR